MTKNQIIEQLYKITNDLVIVGGTAQVFFGKKETAKDIDIVVTEFHRDFFTLGKVSFWKTNSPLSASGKRAFIKRGDFNIDIFIEKKLPTSFGKVIKYETIESMTEYYERIYVLYDKKRNWKQIRSIEKKYELIGGNVEYLQSLKSLK